MDKQVLIKFLNDSMDWAEDKKQSVIKEPEKVSFWEGQKAAYDLVLETIKNDVY